MSDYVTAQENLKTNMLASRPEKVIMKKVKHSQQHTSCTWLEISY